VLRLFASAVSLAYLAVCVLYLLVFLREDTRIRPRARAAAMAAVLLHFLFLASAAVHLGHHPIASVFEAFSTLALMVAILFVYVDIRVGTRSVGLFIFIFVFALQLVSSIFMDFTPGRSGPLEGYILPAHIYLALLGYAAFANGFFYSIMYLLLHRDIRSGRFGKFFRRFPALEELDEMNYRAIVAGLLILLVSIILGIIWFYITYGGLPFYYAKVMFTLFAWALYSVILVLRFLFGWHGRRIAIMSVIGFLIILASMTFVNAFAHSFHAHF